jgi:putative ABC transport system ATP-binding protein
MRLSRQRFIAEARLTDNTDLDFNADWLNFAHDVDPSERSYAIHRLLVSVLEACALKDDVFNMGLRGKVDPEANPDFVERVLAARKRLRIHISDSQPGKADRTVRSRALRERSYSW